MLHCDALIGQQTVFPILANKWPLHSFSRGRPDGDPITGTKNTISITMKAHPDKNTKIQSQFTIEAHPSHKKTCDKQIQVTLPLGRIAESPKNYRDILLQNG